MLTTSLTTFPITAKVAFKTDRSFLIFESKLFVIFKVNYVDDFIDDITDDIIDTVLAQVIHGQCLFSMHYCVDATMSQLSQTSTGNHLFDENADHILSTKLASIETRQTFNLESFDGLAEFAPEATKPEMVTFITKQSCSVCTSNISVYNISVQEELSIL